MPGSSASAPTGPRRRVTNADLAEMMDTNDEWIQSRVGIAERRWADEDETLVEMAVAAGGKALAASGLAPDEIDLVIVASASLRVPIPGIGPQVGYRLGIPRPGAFDLNAGCAGFCYALGVASDSIRSGSARNALVVGVERLTDVTNLEDRTTAVIFADGAGAVVVGASDEPGIGPVVWGSDGDQFNAIEIAAGSATMTMAGQAVYRWATTKLTETLEQAMSSGRRHRGRHRRLRPAPGEPADRRVDDQEARLRRPTSSSPATSSSRATPRPPRSRSP